MPSSYNLVLKEVLGRGRFLKSILCKHDEGLVLVKVYFKRGDSIVLREYERRLAQIRDKFSNLDHPHVWPFQISDPIVYRAWMWIGDTNWLAQIEDDASQSMANATNSDTIGEKNKREKKKAREERKLYPKRVMKSSRTMVA